MRKSFRYVRQAERRRSTAEGRAAAAAKPGPPGDGEPQEFVVLSSLATALGERLHSSGAHPLQDGTAAGVRDFVGRVLDAAGYESVLRSTPLIFGSDVTVRLVSDFVVLKTDRDLLSGETQAISIVEPAEICPAELRELAGERHVRLVELAPDGAASGADRAPWRDAAGRVTTVETRRLAPVIAEIAATLGLTVERRVPLAGSPGDPPASADLRISRGEEELLVFERTASLPLESALSRSGAAIVLETLEELPAAIGTLLKRFDIPAIGPVVELYRQPQPGGLRRFVITVPGWLAGSGSPRLLITGVAPPPLVRLYLTREGIDILEYRLR